MSLRPSGSSGSGDATSKRPWLAALLGLVYPGLGHVYLRLWGRALLWFLFVITATTLLIPAGAYPDTLSVDAMVEAARAIPLTVSLTVLTLTALNAIDAYLMAKRVNGDASGGPAGADTPSESTVPSDGDGARTCPNCGKEVDEDLDFCHWCTTEFETEAED